MGCAFKQNQHGFTLVEISIVMIIIGLLIGGTFGGIKLIENMQVNKTVQDLKAIESAALTFKDTYNRLPGDMPNTAARLPNCTVAPCATGGNGDRTIDAAAASWNTALTVTDERFTFWSHLSAADVLAIGVENTTDMAFGAGQPESPLDGGFRIVRLSGPFAVGNTYRFNGASAFLSPSESATLTSTDTWINTCQSLSAIDNKIDDGLVYNGTIQSWGCSATATATDPYDVNRRGAVIYDLKGI